jgi:hypothetical protein
MPPATVFVSHFSQARPEVKAHRSKRRRILSSVAESIEPIDAAMQGASNTG